ncbi:MAG: SDR family oxidoreductase [Pseudomonadota bacterium]|nr:SDR family oxidoreductase [Pseudomonadota bacterium]
MQNVLIIGATGMLGHKLCQRLPEMGFKVSATVRNDTSLYADYSAIFKDVNLIGNVDVLDDNSVQHTVKQQKYDFVINCVGIIKQRKSAENKLLSIAINAYLPHKLAQICEEARSKLIHISTDCVFDGERGLYHESEETNAKDVYGLTKLLGETDVEETSAITLRTSIIGRQLVEPKLSLIEWFLSQNGKTIKGFNKAIYTGITTEEMARVIALVMNSQNFESGTHHVASTPISKYDLLIRLRDIMKLDIKIEKDDEFFCDRSLIMDSFSKMTGYAAPSWDEMLSELANDQTPYTTNN